MKKTNTKLITYLSGIILLLIGIYMSIFLHNPHFYTPFSVGLFILTLNIYNSLAKKTLFNKWKSKQYALFSIMLIIACIIVDQIGMYLNFWNYPSYTSWIDEIIKIIFEYSVPFMYFMLILLIGAILIRKLGVEKHLSFVLSLLILIPLTLFATEYVNNFSNSWQVTGISNLIWFSIGSWLMAIIPLIIYKITEKTK